MRWLVRILLALAAILVAAFLIFRTPDTDPVEMRAKYGTAPSQFVHVGDDQIFHVRDEGPRDAPVIVLLHGSNSDLRTWDEWADGLKDGYRVIRFDQVGHGLTGPDPQDDYTRANFTEDIRAVTSNLGVERFVLGGNSMGGGHALAYAAAYPEHVSGLVLVCSSGGPPVPRPEGEEGGNLGYTIASIPIVNSLVERITPRSLIERSLQQTVSNKAAVTDEMVDRYWEMLRYPGNRRATMKRFAHDYDPLTENEIASIAVPTLVMWGEEDPLIPLAAGEWLDRTIPQTEFIVYRGIGHLPQKEAPKKSVNDLKAWLVTHGFTT